MSAEEQQFTALYDAKLAELTFNSKPIINALTMIAGANVKFADRVVALIRKRIVSELIAERRLPYIYVMDSILKNIRGAYMVSFGDVAVEIISSTYDAAPAVIKEKLVRLVRTWIDAKLFSTAILDRIQDGIGQRIDASVPLVPSTPVPPPTAATDAQKRSSAAALAAADAAAFEAKRRRIEAQKAPPINPALWAELEERVRQRPELAPLLEDIRHCMRIGADVGPAMQRLRDALLAPPVVYMPPQLHAPPPIPAQMPFGAYPPPYAGAPAVMPMMAPPPLPSDSSLSGLLATLTGLTKTIGAPPVTHLPVGGSELHRRPLGKATAAPIMISLTHTDLKRREEFSIQCLYEALPFRCQSCGFRCPKDGADRVHMDWHFKCNVRAEQQRNAKLSRQWADNEPDWVNMMGGLDLTESQRVWLDDEVPAVEQTAVQCVPEDEEHTTCCVCGDAFEKFWSDADDEWMFRNACRSPEQTGDERALAHPTCLNVEAAGPPPLEQE